MDKCIFILFGHTDLPMYLYVHVKITNTDVYVYIYTYTILFKSLGTVFFFKDISTLIQQLN